MQYVYDITCISLQRKSLRRVNESLIITKAMCYWWNLFERLSVSWSLVQRSKLHVLIRCDPSLCMWHTRCMHMEGMTPSRDWHHLMTSRTDVICVPQYVLARPVGEGQTDVRSCYVNTLYIWGITKLTHFLAKPTQFITKSTYFIAKSTYFIAKKMGWNYMFIAICLMSHLIKTVIPRVTVKLFSMDFYCLCSDPRTF